MIKNSTERRKLRDRNGGRKPAASRARKHRSVAKALGWEMAGTGLALIATILHALTSNNFLDLTRTQFPVQDFCLLTFPSLGKSEITAFEFVGCSDTTQARTYMAGLVDGC